MAQRKKKVKKAPAKSKSVWEQLWQTPGSMGSARAGAKPIGTKVNFNNMNKKKSRKKKGSK